MENKKLVLLVVCLALCVGTCMADDMVDEAKEKAGEAKEGAESFASWAYNKVASGFGATEDDKPPTEELPQNVKYQVQDTASDAAEKVKAVGSGAVNYGKAKMSEMGNKAEETYDQAKQKVGASPTNK